MHSINGMEIIRSTRVQVENRAISERVAPAEAWEAAEVGVVGV